MDWDNMMYQTHIGSWAILILLFVLAYFFKTKVLHMILRLFYVLMVVSGAYMIFGTGGYGTSFHLKAVIAIIMIGFMEMILVRHHKKGQTFKQLLPLWGGMIVLLVVLFLLAYRVISF